MLFVRTVVVSLAVSLLALPVRGEGPIRDNLFLLEEAYNQEPGVIQHIQYFVVDPEAQSWTYSFTEEWPVPTDLHQLSLTVPVLDLGAAEEPRIGDLLVTYRVQALGLGGTGVAALAPRLSLVLPTGDFRRGAGRGALGLQLALPASLELGRVVALHLNAGVTLTPAARSPGGHSETAVDSAVGLAPVWLAASWVNVLVEVLHLTTEELLDDGTSTQRSLLVVNPGLRFAIDTPWALQIVPGVSAPIQIDGEGTTFAALAYLSLEHTLWQGAAARP